MNGRLTVAIGWLCAGLGCAQTAAPGGDETIRLDRITVWGETAPGLLDIVPGQLQWSVPSSMASTAESIPGLAMHHMGAAAAEPLLRGLGSERVVTALDGLPLPVASPTRTNAPLALIASGLPAAMQVSMALPSVTLGPPANAGYIELSSADPKRTSQTNETYLGAAWNADRDGGDLLASQTVAGGPWHVRAAAAAHALGDYRAGNGSVVPAADRSAGVALHFDWQPDARHQLRGGVLYSRQELAVNSALPLDTRGASITAAVAGYNWAVSNQTSIDARLGVSVSRPHLDNSGRPAPALVAADGRSLSLAGAASVRHRIGDTEIIAGLDAAQEERRLERKRPGAVDLLWPDLRQTDLGAYAEMTRPLNPAWKLRLGARIDAAHSEAHAADGVAFNRSIRDLYVAYNGPDAARTNRDDLAGAANLQLTGQLAPNLTTSLGAGFRRQPPGATERYRAFSDALGGGYEIGNPAADAEDKYDVTGGLRWQRDQLTVAVDLFVSYLPDYLHRTRVGTTAPPPPGAIVYGYRAAAAEFHGGELEALWQPSRGSWWRLAVASVDGTDRDTHRRLPEIPPATLTLAAGRMAVDARLRPWFECGLRAAAAQRNPAPDEMPVFADTSAHALVNLRGGLTWRGWRVALAAENVLNRLYYDYLSPPAAATPPSGTLRPGAPIPGPGRTFTVTVSHGLP